MDQSRPPAQSGQTFDFCHILPNYRPFSYWFFDRSVAWWFDWLIGRSIDWLIDWLCHWWFDWLIDWLTTQLMVWLIDWLIDWLRSWWFDWLIDYAADGLIDWLIDWLISMISWNQMLKFFVPVVWLPQSRTDWNLNHSYPSLNHFWTFLNVDFRSQSIPYARNSAAAAVAPVPARSHRHPSSHHVSSSGSFFFSIFFAGNLTKFVSRYSVDNSEGRKMACYDVDVDVDDPAKPHMTSFSEGVAQTQEIQALDNKVHFFKNILEFRSFFHSSSLISIDRLIDRSIGRMLAWLIDGLYVWLIDWLIVCMYVRLIDWLIDCMYVWLIDWLIDSLLWSWT